METKYFFNKNKFSLKVSKQKDLTKASKVVSCLSISSEVEAFDAPILWRKNLNETMQQA